jgi:DNA end-binding protein Ku
MAKKEVAEQEEVKTEKTEKQQTSRVPKRPIWSGNITIGLVNVPVKLKTMIFDKGMTFRFLHKADGSPLRYDRVCIKDDQVVPWADIIKGYEVSKGKFLVFEKKELEAAKPESDSRIRIDKFVDYLSTDPIYFERSFILVPDKSDEPYSLLLTALEKIGKAGAGRITLRTKEYPVLIHPYKGALILTIMRYPYEVADPSQLEELKKLKEPRKDELDLATKIISDLSGEFNITEYEDSYKEKIEELIKKKMKGEVIVFEKPMKEEAAKELMEALQETLKQLKKT